MKDVVEKNAVVRSAGSFKVSAQGLLSNGIVKRHAEWFCSSEASVAAILNALVFSEDEDADRSALVNATAKAHFGNGRHAAFKSPESESELLEKEHLQPSTLSSLRFTAGSIASLTQFRGNSSLSMTHERSLGEELEYALKQHLQSRGLRVEVLLAAAEKAAMRKATQGSVDYRRDLAEPISFVECASRTNAYSAAWLATSGLLQAVDMTPRATLEWHSHNIFINVFYQNRRKDQGTYGYAFKTSDYRDFYVNHLSHFDHRASESQQQKMAAAAERSCLKRNKGSPYLEHRKPVAYSMPGSSKSPTHAWKSVALVPFWGGSAQESGGNAHSNAKHGVKVSQLLGTVCSALKPFEFAAVGVCTERDRDAVLSSLNTWEVGPVAAIQFSSLNFDDSLPHRDASNLNQNLKHLKLSSAGLSQQEKGDLLKKHPEILSKIYKMFDINDAVFIKGTPVELENAAVVIFQFDCAVGVHLPYHLLQLAQTLLRNTRGKPARASSRNGVVSHGHGGIADHGALAEYDWGDVDYLYFTEADQITEVRNSAVLSALVSMLNASNYIAPQRMMMRGGNSAVLARPDFDKKSISELLHDAWVSEASHKRRRLLDAKSGTESSREATTDNRQRHRRLFMPHAGERLGKPSKMALEPLAMENECSPGAGEPGYLGPSRVHEIGRPSG